MKVDELKDGVISLLERWLITLKKFQIIPG
jgi:hypothetical protein